ncbi:MAG TPA: DUF4097 family beta strand repeat-containing protein [Streptosporangiaceae bacterium]|nr:DUF4097 family beta strand repeat-containing protein [Streptosporangiaceae bacterium]
MTRWTIDSPAALDFDGIVALRVRIVAGSVAVLATADKPRLEVTEVSGQPLLVTHEAGILTIGYEDLSWNGLRGWLKPQRHSANITIMVQKDCPTQVGVMSASAVVSGVSARTSLKSVSGDMTLDGVAGAVDVNTVSGNVEAQDLNGQVVFHSVSGDLTLADGCIGGLDAKTMGGGLTADVALGPAGEMKVSTLSGDVALRLPVGTDARVDLRTKSGRMHSDFDALKPSISAGTKSLAGTLGTGSGKLTVSSMSGDVTILRRSRRLTPEDLFDGGEPGEPAGSRAEERTEEAATMGMGGSTEEGDAR